MKRYLLTLMISAATLDAATSWGQACQILSPQDIDSATAYVIGFNLRRPIAVDCNSISAFQSAEKFDLQPYKNVIFRVLQSCKQESNDYFDARAKIFLRHSKHCIDTICLGTGSTLVKNHQLFAAKEELKYLLDSLYSDREQRREASAPVKNGKRVIIGADGEIFLEPDSLKSSNPAYNRNNRR